jgi:hypothetical protein
MRERTSPPIGELVDLSIGPATTRGHFKSL